ncbi:MAG TPA: hypothetical protein VK426_09010 [Methanobacterium sp.]|nr:hypothetical protein [Methanobacterium sp.]
MSEKDIKVNSDLIEMLEATDEYKAWLDSLFAIIGYTSQEKNDDESLIVELMADHLSASFQLQDGLENAKRMISKKMHEDWVLDNSGQ